MSKLLCVLVLVAGCASASSDDPPDALSTVPRTAAGSFVVQSSLAFGIPEAARPIFDLLADATDGPDDPSRFVVDRLILQLPASAQGYAATVAPYVAAYLQSHLSAFAPRLAPGLSQLTTQLAKFAQHLDTDEAIRISSDGEMVRTITGVHFDHVAIDFASAGLPELAASALVQLRDGTLEIPSHELALPYKSLLRLALDRAVVPAIAPKAVDLASVLGDLVDCDKLGTLIADDLGIGSDSLYAGACVAAMTAVAARVDAGIDAIQDPLRLDVAGSATGYDADGDGTMDAIRDGRWHDQPGSAFALTTGTFTGAK